MSEGNRILDIIGELLCNDGTAMLGRHSLQLVMVSYSFRFFLRWDRCSCVCSTFVSASSSCDMN
jgi:hypothetical protein